MADRPGHGDFGRSRGLSGLMTGWVLSECHMVPRGRADRGHPNGIAISASESRQIFQGKSSGRESRDNAQTF